MVIAGVIEMWLAKVILDAFDAGTVPRCRVEEGAGSCFGEWVCK